MSSLPKVPSPLARASVSQVGSQAKAQRSFCLEGCGALAHPGQTLKSCSSQGLGCPWLLPCTETSIEGFAHVKAAAPSHQETAQHLGSCSLTSLGFPACQGGFMAGSGWAPLCVIVGFLEFRSAGQGGSLRNEASTQSQ